MLVHSRVEIKVHNHLFVIYASASGDRVRRFANSTCPVMISSRPQFEPLDSEYRP